MKRILPLLNQILLFATLITLINMATVHAQAGGNVLKLGGTNGYVEVPGFAIENGGPVTIEFWSYTSASDVQSGSAFTVGGNSANPVQANVPWSDYYLYWDYGSSGRLKADYVPYLNKWTHVALVSEGKDGGFKAIYLDGVLQAWDLSSDGPGVRVSGLTIGKNGTFFHRGVIDEFRIWNVVREEAEILDLMSKEATGFESGLATVFHFNETAGATTTTGDVTNPLNGILAGDATIVTRASLDPAPYVLTCERHSPTDMQTNVTGVTFRVIFSESVTGVAAQDFETVVTGELHAGYPTVSKVNATTYDVSVSVDGVGSVQLSIAGNASITDATGNPCDQGIIGGETYWVSQARFLSVWPESGALVNNTTISYQLSLRLASGNVTWTRVGGTADPASPHVQALSGDERNDGEHNDITLVNNPVLVSGTFYTVTFNGIAADGQIVPEVSILDVLFDRGLTHAGPDPTFNPGEGAIDIRSMALQNDSKIIIGGGFTNFNGTDRNRVARLNNDGSLDTSFDPGTGANNLVNSVRVQPDSKILIAGMFTQYNETNSGGIVRVNPDGALDGTFNTEIGNLEISAMVLQGDKIIVGGYSFLGLEPTLVRLNADGSTDASLNVGDGPDGRVTCMFAQPDGKIMVGGRFSEYNSFSTSSIVRVNPDGAVSEDFVFDYDALDFNDDLESITAMIPQADGKIIVTVLSSFFDGSMEYISRVLRLNADGTTDETFNIVEIATDDSGDKPRVNAMHLQEDGKIIIVGYFEKCAGEDRNNIARLNADGTLDQSFYPDPGADDTIYALQIQTDGNILIAGEFSTYNAHYVPGIARIDPVGPAVVSSVRHTPSTATTNATSVTFRVTFSEPVTDVGTNDFTVTTSGNVAYGALTLSAVSSTTYDITIPSISGTGTLRLDVLNIASITDLPGNSFNTIFETGEAYTIIFCVNPDQPVITASFTDPAHPVLTSSAPTGNQWYFNNEVIAGATGSSYTIAAPGVYKVQVATGDCVSEFSADYALVITGLPENISEKMTIYPNPARDVIAVEGITAEEKLQVIGVTGKVYAVTPASRDGLTTMNIAGLAPGVYVLQAAQRNGVRTMRFVKE